MHRNALRYSTIRKKPVHFIMSAGKKMLKPLRFFITLLSLGSLAIADEHALTPKSSAISITVRAFTAVDSQAVKNYAAVLYDSSGTKVDSLVAVDTNMVRFSNVPITGVNSSSASPVGYSLDQNYPNPFNPSSRIRFSVGRSGPVALRTYTILGQEDATLEMTLEAGSYEVQYTPGGAAGVLFYRLITGEFTETKKMVQFGGDKPGKSRLTLVLSAIMSRSRQSRPAAEYQANNFKLQFYNLPATTPAIVDMTSQITGLKGDTTVIVYMNKNQPPNQPSLPDPPDNATGMFPSLSLAWTCTDPEKDPLTYDLYFGTDNPPLTKVDSSLTTPRDSISDLSDSTAYYWRIVAKDNHRHTTSGPVWRFSTFHVTMPHTQLNAILYYGMLAQPGDTLLVIDKFTETFPGIQFTFGMIDPNSLTKEYSWNVDSVKNPDGTLHWSDWNSNATAFINASDFDPAKKYETDHAFSVRSRNEFGGIDTTGFFGNIVTQNGSNNLQSFTQTTVVRLDKEGSLRPTAGNYGLVAQAGTNPGTLELIYNNGPPVDNIPPRAKGIVLNGGIAGALTVDLEGIPQTFPQVDSVAVVVASVKFHTIYPKFARDATYRRYLILHNSYHWSPANVTPFRPSYPMIESFYSSIFDSLGKGGQYDIYDVPEISTTGEKDFVSLGDLANYSAVFVVAETDSFWSNLFGGVYGSQPLRYMFDAERIEKLQTYCDVGGKVVISAANFLCVANSDPLVANMISIGSNSGDEVREGYPDLIGATGDTTIGYPNAIFDRQKIDTTVCPVGALNDIWAVTPIGLGQGIYRYQSSGCDTSTQGAFFNQKVIGTRYQGSTYSVIFYGFPLYYCQFGNARDILKSTLIDIDEN